MLRIATRQDFEYIKRLALDFFYASPYQPLGVSEKRVEDLIENFLQADIKDNVLLLWCDPEPVGVLAALANTNLFNEQRIAGEVIWWIDPKYRRSPAAKEMLGAYEYWWKNVAKCQIGTVVDLMGNLDKYYTKKGYSRRETVYIK